MKTIALPQFLTEMQIRQAARLFALHGGSDARQVIQARVIEPNMDEINRKLGQENDAAYLAWAVVYALMSATTGETLS